jgi:aminoglycoside 3-N-acetyltransferase
MITKQEIMDHLQRFGVTSESELEVHSSLSSFGIVDGGAETVIDALKDVCVRGSIFIPALRLSPELPLTEADKKMGISTKIKILPPNAKKQPWE